MKKKTYFCVFKSLILECKEEKAKAKENLLKRQKKSDIKYISSLVRKFNLKKTRANERERKISFNEILNLFYL